MKTKITNTIYTFTIHALVINSFLLTTATVTLMAQSAGSLDSTFGTGGKVMTDFGSSNDHGESIVLQSDGKIVVAGSSFNTNNGYYDFALVRYNSDGSLDNSFGIAGKVTTDFASFDDRAYSVVIQSDGKIIVAGSSANTTWSDFALVRFNSDGSLDNSFGTGGKVATDLLEPDIGKSVVIQSDGKIIVSGHAGFFTQEIALVRYNSDGSLDGTFGTGGKVITFFGNMYGRGGYSVALLSNGKIVVAGTTYNLQSYEMDFVLVQYNSDGSLDNTFGSGGKVTTDFGGFNDVGESVAIQSDGKILVAGFSHDSIFTNATNHIAFALARYNSDGSLDNTFGSSGKVKTHFGAACFGGVGSCDQGYSIALQNDGKILVAGSSSNGNNLDFALLRYNNDGSLDNTFGSGGKVMTDFGGLDDEGHAITLQSDGKIVVAGTGSNGNNFDFAVARYHNDLFSGISTIEEQYTKMEIYPNPFNSSTTIQFNTTVKNVELSIYNMFGQNVKTIKNISGDKIKIDRDNLSCGVYFVRLTKDNKVIATEKLVITD